MVYALNPSRNPKLAWFTESSRTGSITTKKPCLKKANKTCIVSLNQVAHVGFQRAETASILETLLAVDKGVERRGQHGCSSGANQLSP